MSANGFVRHCLNLECYDLVVALAQRRLDAAFC
jgi:hypothetical protein